MSTIALILIVLAAAFLVSVFAEMFRDAVDFRHDEKDIEDE